MIRRLHRTFTKRLLPPAVLGLSVGLALPLAAEPASTRVQDLHYGTVLFQFYQQNHFNALTELLAAQQLERFRHHNAEAELLRGGLNLSYGLHDEAERIFRRLLTRETAADVRNRAWYFLARTTYEKGLFEEAVAALAQIDGELDLDLAGERQLLLALVQMGQGNYTAAAAALEPWQGGEDNRPYAAFNRGVALIRSGEREAGIAVLEELGRMRARTPQQEALRDKANMAAGYAYLQVEQPALAQPHLARVRLEGPQSNQALLLAGMSESASGRHREALAPWTVLQERPSNDPAVQEALVSIPQVHAELGDYSRAVSLFNRNIGVLEEERAELRRIMKRIDQGELIAAMALEEATAERADAAAHLPGQSYLIGLLAGHRFHQAFQNYLDLRALEANLDYWADSVDSFDDMIATQRARLQQRVEAKQARFDGVDGPGLLQRKQALHDTLNAIDAGGDIMALATPEEQRQWQQLQVLDADLATLPPDSDNLELQVRFWRVLGEFLHAVDETFQVRLKSLRSDLHATEEAVAALERRRAEVAAVQRSVQARLNAFEQRVTLQRERITQLQPQVEAALQRQRDYLQALALNELENRGNQLDEQIIRARYALARALDQAARGSQGGAGR